MHVEHVSTAKGIVEMINLGAIMHQDSTFAGMDYDREVLAETLLRLADTDDGLLLLARDDQDKPIGCLAAMVTQSFFGKDRVASELALFVHPGRRGGLAAVRLVREYVRWAKARGAKRVNVGNSAGMDDERYVGLMNRLGFTRAGSLMFMEG